MCAARVGGLGRGGAPCRDARHCGAWLSRTGRYPCANTGLSPCLPEWVRTGIANSRSPSAASEVDFPASFEPSTDYGAASRAGRVMDRCCFARNLVADFSDCS